MKITNLFGMQYKNNDFWENRDVENVSTYDLFHDIYNDLNLQNIKVKDMYVILQNRDEGVKPHFHFLLSFDKQYDLDKVAKIVGIEPQYFEVPKRGGSPIDGRSRSIDNFLAYLIHAKEKDDKYKYSPEEVITIAGDDYKKIYESRINDWREGRKKKVDKEFLVKLIDDVYDLKIPKKKFLLDDELKEVYKKYSTKIDEAFLLGGKFRAAKISEKINSGVLAKVNVFIHGDTGLGKTRFAKSIIADLEAKVNAFAYQGASKNPLDDYAGEDIIFLDDTRGYSLSLINLLALTDPFSTSPISARYYNKQNVAPLLNLFTSVQNPLVYFAISQMDEKGGEPIGQWLRRLNYCVNIIDKSRCELYSYPPSEFPQPYVINIGYNNLTFYAKYVAKSLGTYMIEEAQKIIVENVLHNYQLLERE